jgi:hypothetical protein
MTQNALRRLDKLSLIATAPPSVLTRRRPTSVPPRVSVIVRTRNRPDTLRIALNSLAHQTLDHFEVVLVNSGDSVDNIVSDFEEHLQIRLVTPSTLLSLGDALNAGVESASSEYITYLDDDDVAYPFHLASLVQAASVIGGDEQFVYSHYNWAFVARRANHEPRVIARQRSAPWAYNRSELLIQNKPALHTWLHSRTLVERLGGFDPSLELLEDWDFLLRASLELDLVLHPRETCEYRFFLDSKSAMADRSNALRHMREIYSRHPATSRETALGRYTQLAAMERQSGLVESVLRRREIAEVSGDDAVREVVRIQFGLELPRLSLQRDFDGPSAVPVET